MNLHSLSIRNKLFRCSIIFSPWLNTAHPLTVMGRYLSFGKGVELLKGITIYRDHCLLYAPAINLAFGGNKGQQKKAILIKKYTMFLEREHEKIMSITWKCPVAIDSMILQTTSWQYLRLFSSMWGIPTVGTNEHSSIGSMLLGLITSFEGRKSYLQT